MKFSLNVIFNYCIIMKYLLGKEEKGVGTVVELFIDELAKLATMTESRRWYILNIS